MDEMIARARALGLGWTPAAVAAEGVAAAGAAQFSAAPDSPELHVACRTLERLAGAVPGAELHMTDSMNALHVAPSPEIAVYMARRRRGVDWNRVLNDWIHGFSGKIREIAVEREPTWPIRLGWPCLAVSRRGDRTHWKLGFEIWPALPAARIEVANPSIALSDVTGGEVVATVERSEIQPIERRGRLFLEVSVAADQSTRVTALAVSADLHVDLRAPIHRAKLRAPADLRDHWHGWNVGGRERGYTGGTDSKVLVQWRRDAEVGFAEVRVIVAITHRFADVWPDGELRVVLGPGIPALVVAFASSAGSQEHTLTTRLAVASARSVEGLDIALLGAVALPSTRLLLAGVPR